MLKEERCEDSFLELSRRYENVFYKICQRYKFALRSVGVQPEDVYEEKNTILFKCALSYDSERGTKFSTWLGNYAKFTCLNYINSKKYTFNAETEELHDFVENSQIAPEGAKTYDEEMDIAISALNALKDKRIKKIFERRYFYDYKKESTWKNISDGLGISIQTAINLHKKGLRLLKNQLKDKINIDKD